MSRARNSHIREHRFACRHDMLDAVYLRVVDELTSSCDNQDQISLFLSGGSTPGPLYRALSGADLPWHKIHVALVDERWVDANHAASNERLVRDTLLSGKAKPASFTSMKNSADSARDGQPACEESYRQLPDYVALGLLGMGTDGHTASLFPHAQGLTEAVDSEQRCAAIHPQKSAVTGDYLERMSLTPAALLKSQRLILLITGDDKWDVYQQAKQAQDPLAMPLALLLQQNSTPINVYWAP